MRYCPPWPFTCLVPTTRLFSFSTYARYIRVNEPRDRPDWRPRIAGYREQSSERRFREREAAHAHPGYEEAPCEGEIRRRACRAAGRRIPASFHRRGHRHRETEE